MVLWLWKVTPAPFERSPWEATWLTYAAVDGSLPLVAGGPWLSFWRQFPCGMGGIEVCYVKKFHWLPNAHLPGLGCGVLAST